MKDLLKDWASFGCPAKMGCPWTKAEMWETVKQGPNRFTLSEAVLEHFAVEAVKMVHPGPLQNVIFQYPLCVPMVCCFGWVAVRSCVMWVRFPLLHKCIWLQSLPQVLGYVVLALTYH
jgi:hypothetical protein